MSHLLRDSVRRSAICLYFLIELTDIVLFVQQRLATENFGMSEFETKQLENKNVVLPSAVSEMTNNNHNEIFASSENLGATESKPSVDRNAAPDNSVPSTPDDGTNKSGDSTKEINKDEKQDMIDSSSANNKGSNDTKSSSEDPSNKEKDTTGSITPPTVPVVIDESSNGDKSNGNSSTGLDTTTLGLVSVIIVIGIILYRIYKRSDANTSGGTNSAIKNTAYTRLPQSEDTRRGGDIEMRGGGGNVHEYDDMAAYENAAGEVWEEWESCDEAPPPAFPNSHSNSNSHIMNSSSSFVAGSTYATPSSNTTTISRIPSPGASLTSLPMTTTAAAASAIRGGSPPATSSTFSNGIQSSSFNKSMSYSGSNNNSRNVSNDRLSSATTTGGFSPPPPPITSTHTTTATMMMNGSNNSLNSINSIGNSNNHAAPNNTAAASAIKPKTANSRQKQDIDLFAVSCFYCLKN